MKNKINKKILSKKISFESKDFKWFSYYIFCHPVAIIKALFILIFYGPNEFLVRLDKIKELNSFANIKKSNILTQIFAIIFIILFFLISILFFSLYKAFYLLLYVIRKKMKIAKNKKRLNGISFIIPTWNKKDMVLECVKHLDKIASSEAKDIPKEIIVIDNGSVDNTTEALNNLKTTTSLKVIYSKTNLGFARGINLGASKAKYNYIYLMNNDMIPKPKLISEIVSFAKKLLKENKPFFGLSSQIFFYDLKKRREESGKNYYRPDFGYLYVAHCVNENNLQSSSITGYPGGGSSLINKDIFLQLGGYDKDVYLPLYDEDLDLGFVAWKFGFPSYFVPTSQIIHHHQSSTKKLSMDPNYYMFKNWLTFILKNYDSCSLILGHLLLYPLRMVSDKRFGDYAWQNLKIFHKILYKKIILSRFKIVYKDSELINFLKFEFNFESMNEK